jgi:fructokinase
MVWSETAADDSPVLVVGEALVDVIVGDDDERREIPGGSAANVALGLARRGLPVRLATCLASDEYGRVVSGALAAEGVSVDASSYNASRTSTAIARRDEVGDVSYEFDVEWNLPDLDLGATLSAIHLGSFPAFSSDLEMLTDMLSAARARFATSWDPNVRPALAKSQEDARRRFHALIGSLDLLKLSDADADYLLPGLVPDEIADLALAAGVRSVIITLGAKGMLMASAADRVLVPAVQGTVVDTIGAGDTVMCSLIADLVQGRWHTTGGLEAVGRRAAAAAAITVSRPGADLPRAGELGL